MSIRFKVILPYLLLTLIVAVTGAYVVTRLVSSSLGERLTNQLLEAARVVSGTMARQEVKASRGRTYSRLYSRTGGRAPQWGCGSGCYSGEASCRWTERRELGNA